MSRRLHWQARVAAEGSVVNVYPFSTRIDENVEICWVIKAICRAVDWPRAHLKFIVGTRVFMYTHRIRDYDRTRLLDLCKERTKEEALDDLTVMVLKERPYAERQVL